MDEQTDTSLPPTPAGVSAVPPVQSQPTISPQTEQGIQRSVAFRYVGFGRRSVAAIIDGIILFIVNIGVALPANLLLGTSEEGTALVQILVLLINTAIFYIYSVGFLTAKGATPGKMAMGIKVVTVNGEAVSLGRAALREIIGKFVSGLFFALGYLWVIWDTKKQGWHDKIAGTVVIYSK